MKCLETFQPDVVIAVDDDAQEYFARGLGGRDKPQVVFCGVSADPFRFGYPAKNVTGILDRPFLKETARLLSAIDPKIRRLAFVSDKSETGDALLDYLKAQNIAPMSVTAYERANTLQEWKEAVLRHQNDSDAVVVGMYRGLSSQGQPNVDPEEVMDWTVSASRLPVAGLVDYAVENGALGGVVESSFEQGLEAGELVKRVLAGGSAGDIPIAVGTKGAKIFNMRAAQRWGLQLPQNMTRGADRLITGLRTSAAVTLCAVAAMVDERLAGFERGLSALAATQEARSADWKRIQPLLAGFLPDAAEGTAWFALPDGSYYTAANGPEKANLADRPYFAKLLAGREALGEAVVSRATGRKAAVVAVPVREGGVVVGALGVSLYCEELMRLIERKVELPGYMVFYALTPDGVSILHRDPRRLLESPSKLGSESLAAAVNDMLYKQEGAVTYFYNGMRRTVAFKASPLTGWRFALGSQRPAQDAERALKYAAQEVLLRLSGDVKSVMAGLDNGLSLAAKRLAQTGLEGPAARQVLAELCGGNPEAVTCAAVDPQGTMTTVEPFEYRVFQGAQIGKQEHFGLLRESKKPVMSRVFRAVEGFGAVALEYPVLSASGELLGAVSVVIRPDLTIAKAAAPAVEGLPLSAWVMQDDGRILYDPDEPEIGRILFEDELYKPFPRLQELGRRIVAEESGTGTYEFPVMGKTVPVRKQAFWNHFVLYGTAWSFVVTIVPEEVPAKNP